MKVIIKCLMLIVLFSTINLKGQEKEKFTPKIKWNLTTQIWFRYSDLNERSLINGETTNSYLDVSLRRLRIPISSQVTPKLFLYSIFGGNNYNFQDRSFSTEILGLYAEYSFSKKLEVGFGKSGWQGLSRHNVRSSKSLMGLDSPLIVLTTVNKNDYIGRSLGIWAKGQINKIDYRISFSRPTLVTSVPNGKVDFANNRPRIRTSSYVKYQFLNHEYNKLAYLPGTYVIGKKVFNIGAGFQYQE